MPETDTRIKVQSGTTTRTFKAGGWEVSSATGALHITTGRLGEVVASYAPGQWRAVWSTAYQEDQ